MKKALREKEYRQKDKTKQTFFRTRKLVPVWLIITIFVALEIYFGGGDFDSTVWDIWIVIIALTALFGFVIRSFIFFLILGDVMIGFSAADGDVAGAWIGAAYICGACLILFFFFALWLLSARRRWAEIALGILFLLDSVTPFLFFARMPAVSLFCLAFVCSIVPFMMASGMLEEAPLPPDIRPLKIFRETCPGAHRNKAGAAESGD